MCERERRRSTNGSSLVMNILYRSLRRNIRTKCAQITRKSTTSQRKHCYTTESICFLVKNKRPNLARITMKETLFVNFQKILVPSCLGFMLFFFLSFYTKQARQNTAESNIVKLTVRSTVTLCGEQNKLTAPLQSEIMARQPPTVMSGRKAA